MLGGFGWRVIYSNRKKIGYKLRYRRDIDVDRDGRRHGYVKLEILPYPHGTQLQVLWFRLANWMMSNWLDVLTRRICRVRMSDELYPPPTCRIASLTHYSFLVSISFNYHSITRSRGCARFIVIGGGTPTVVSLSCFLAGLRWDSAHLYRDGEDSWTLLHLYLISVSSSLFWSACLLLHFSLFLLLSTLSACSSATFLNKYVNALLSTSVFTTLRAVRESSDPAHPPASCNPETTNSKIIEDNTEILVLFFSIFFFFKIEESAQLQLGSISHITSHHMTSRTGTARITRFLFTLLRLLSLLSAILTRRTISLTANHPLTVHCDPRHIVLLIFVSALIVLSFSSSPIALSFQVPRYHTHQTEIEPRFPSLNLQSLVDPLNKKKKKNHSNQILTNGLTSGSHSEYHQLSCLASSLLRCLVLLPLWLSLKQSCHRLPLLPSAFSLLLPVEPQTRHNTCIHPLSLLQLSNIPPPSLPQTQHSQNHTLTYSPSPLNSRHYLLLSVNHHPFYPFIIPTYLLLSPTLVLFVYPWKTNAVCLPSPFGPPLVLAPLTTICAGFHPDLPTYSASILPTLPPRPVVCFARPLAPVMNPNHHSQPPPREQDYQMAMALLNHRQLNISKIPI
ncbi:hypothetical protein VP01_895g3 [Puccinia sorghi]|uniref:Uncharacterized protein n=1 Tax=Puccinia sorghi TaxID=27349 RepID=A0A0L6UA34_9BASI|nr:hypothetical protein VP01_895g3 [Puccinia sorghi]